MDGGRNGAMLRRDQCSCEGADGGIDEGMRENVLIWRLGSLGDTVVALPALKLIRDRHPGARRVLLTVSREAVDLGTGDPGMGDPETGDQGTGDQGTGDRGVGDREACEQAPGGGVPGGRVFPAAVVEGMGLIDDTIVYREGERRPGATVGLLRRLRSYRFHTAYYLNLRYGRMTVLRDRLFLAATGARRIVGVPLSADPSGIAIVTDGLVELEARRLWRAVGGAGMLEPAAFDLELTERDRAPARRVAVWGDHAASATPVAVGPLIAFAPASNMSTKVWPKDRWVAVIRRLHAETGCRFVLIGGPGDTLPREICEAAVVPHVDTCGRLSVRVSAAVMENARLFLGVDSGPMHLAAAVGLPVVALFSALDRPGKWYPYGDDNTVLQGRAPCAGCMLRDGCPHDTRCLKTIEVDAVVAACLARLTRVA